MRVENWRGKEVFDAVIDAAMVGLNAVMDEHVADAKMRCPVGTITRKGGYVQRDVLFTTKRGKEVNFIANTWVERIPGSLKATVRKVEKYDRPGNLRCYAGTNKVFYACIYGSGTTVKTPDGFKAICCIKEGDFVIGQDGMPHEVLLKNSFPAKNKPNLVRLTVEWRSDRNHLLTVTDDHKILTIKDGVSFWMKAGDLKEGDLVFCPKKIPSNKGQGKKKVCINCQKEFSRQESQGKKYCSVQCRDEYWERRFSKSINPCPLPGVRYMQCNNSMNSFVDMTYFEARKIIKKEAVDARDSDISLYDLSIKDVHSFIASGIIVSNSFVEYGTVKAKAQPFLRPSFQAIKGTVKDRIEAEMRKVPEVK